MNQEEINEAIELLKENKEKCPKTNFFGEDNMAPIDAMIDVLENDLDYDEIEEKYYDEQNPRVEHSANDMREFLDGNGGEIQDYLILIP